MTHALDRAREEEAPPATDNQLADFARAFRAAARAVTLYPEGHPAVTSTLNRLADLTSVEHLETPMRVGVLADSLRLDGRPAARPDRAIEEVAALLHTHFIGELTVRAGGDARAWQTFFGLLGRTPESVRSEGGIARLWASMGDAHLDVQEIDYTEALRERPDGESADWDEVIASCLKGTPDLNDEQARLLAAIAADAAKLIELVAAIDGRGGGRGVRSRTAALVRLVERIIAAVNRHAPEQLELVLKNVATALGQLPPEMVVALVTSHPPTSSISDENHSPRPMDTVVSHMSDETVARFVARNAVEGRAPIERIAQAFQALVRDPERRERLVSLAHEEALATPGVDVEGLEQSWEQMAEKLLTSYSDEPFVSRDYARELSTTPAEAVSVEQVSDDPPERVNAWLTTVATSELRRLDLTLVSDLLLIEHDVERWKTLLGPVLTLVDDLFLVGDFEAVEQLVGAVVREKGPKAPSARREASAAAVDAMIAGPATRHIVAHLATIDDEQFVHAKNVCLLLGETLIGPLAEALAVEQRSRTRQRLIQILIAVGAIGRREVDRLKNSPDAAVRRTAVHLLRELGGSDALPQLIELIDDAVPQVQREAVRAILNIGTDRAFEVLERALAGGTAASRQSLMKALASIRDERAAPLFTYILRHVDHRGQLGPIYLRAIEALGTLGDSSGVAALREVLYRGEWWAPRRSALFRTAAASALARIGTPEATAALEQAASSGPRGARAAARAQIVRIHRTGTERGRA